MANRNLKGDVNVEFTEASSRQGLDSGESVKTLFGKIRKWLSDLKAVAFSGSYKDLIEKPTLGSAASKNVPSTGNASTSEVVMGNDSRLSDSRPASDVSAWAKATTKPTYTASEVGAATSAQGAKADSAVQTIQIGGTTQTKTNGTVNLPSYPTKSSLGLGNVDNTSDANKPISTAMQAVLDKQQAQIDKALEQTGYNLVKITATTQTVNGITFTVDEKAGTITANGTATALTTFALSGLLSNILEVGNSYYMTGCPAGGSYSSNYALYVALNGVTVWRDEGSGEQYSVPQSGTLSALHLVIRSGVTVNNLVFKPMIVPAELAGIPFQPYAKSNAELTQDLNDISAELDCLIIQAALVNNEVIIQNTSDFTRELYSKYFSYTKPKFAILKLQITSSTYYYKALINSSSVSQATVMEASFITVNGEYMSIYNFKWNLSGTVGTPTVTRKSLNLGS